MSSILAFANTKQPVQSANVDRTLSEERARNAVLWVEKEIDKLVSEIETIGQRSGNEVQITFGELFNRYQDVSDTLVGILQRAKKRGILKYQGEGGDLLLQGRHNHVMIYLDHAKAQAWQKEYKASGGKLPTPVASVSNSSASRKPVAASLHVSKPAVAVTTATSMINKVAKASTTVFSKPNESASHVSKHTQGSHGTKSENKVTGKKPDASPVVLIGIGIGLLIIVLMIFFFIVRLLFGR